MTIRPTAPGPALFLHRWHSVVFKPDDPQRLIGRNETLLHKIGHFLIQRAETASAGLGQQAGRRLALTDALGIDNLDPTKSEVYAYDDLNRLLQVAEGLPLSQGGVPVPVEDYAYDGEGNRTASHLSAAHLSSDHNQLLEDDSYTYAYDARGNRISRTSKATGAVETYSYDSQNRLIGYTSPDTTATYAYDALDRRIAKTVDGVTEAWVYDSDDLSDSTASDTALTFRAGALVKRWLFGPSVDEPLAYEAYTGTTAPGSGSVIELLANRLGSIITAISISTGAVAAEYDYQAYGARTETATLDQPYGFTGREHDSESGLMHFRARAYDPETGLFLQVDPIEFTSGDTNLFSYSLQDPQNLIDPSGFLVTQAEFKKLVKDGVASAIGASRVNAATLKAASKIIEGLSAVIDAHNSYVDEFNSGRTGGGNSGASTSPQVCYGGVDKNGNTQKVGVAKAEREMRRWKEQKLTQLYGLKQRRLLSIPAQVAARALAYALEEAIAHVLRELNAMPEWKHLKLPCHKKP